MRLPTTREVYEVLRRNYGHVEGWTHQTGYAIARRAREAARTALEMQARPDAPHAATRPPRQESHGSGQERYEYDVVVRFTRPDGTPDSSVVTVPSPVPLSAEVVAQFAADQIDWTAYPSGRASRQRAIGRALAGGEYTAEVIAVHRTR